MDYAGQSSPFIEEQVQNSDDDSQQKNYSIIFQQFGGWRLTNATARKPDICRPTNIKEQLAGYGYGFGQTEPLASIGTPDKPISCPGGHSPFNFVSDQYSAPQHPPVNRVQSQYLGFPKEDVKAPFQVLFNMPSFLQKIVLHANLTVQT